MPWPVEQSDLATLRGEIAQRVLPALEARVAAARARVDAVDDVFSGRADAREALPELTPEDLQSRPALEVLLARLDGAGVDREAARREPVPDLGNTRLMARLTQVWQAALDAEAQADQAERRLVYGLLAVVQAHPLWELASVQAARAPGEAAWTAAREAVASASDAQRDEALRALATWTRARARWSSLAAEVRSRVLSGTEAPIDVAAEREVLQAPADGVALQDAVERLRRVAPWVPAETRAEADAAVLRWLTGPELARHQALLDGAKQRLDAAQGRDPGQDVGELEAARQAAEAEATRLQDLAQGEFPGDEDAAAARRALAELDAQTAQVEVEILDVQLSGLASVESSARDAAEAARQAQLRAQLVAGEHPAYAMRVASRSWTTTAFDLIRAESDRRTAEQAQRASDLDVFEDAAAAFLQGRTPTGDAAAWGVDGLHARVRAQLDEVRTEIVRCSEPAATLLEGLPSQEPVAQRRAQLEAWRAEIAAIPDEEAQHVLSEVVSDTEAALADEAQPALQAEVLQRETLDLLLEDLRRIKALRHDLSGRLSSEARRAESARYFTDLSAETRLLSYQIRTLARERLLRLSAIPSTLWNLELVLAGLRGMAWSLALIAAWAWARRRTATLVEGFHRQLDRWVVKLTPTAASALTPTSAGLVRALVDLSLGVLLTAPARGVAPELGVLVSVWSIVAGFRVAGALLALLAAPPDERRPSLVVVSPEARVLARRTWWLIASWFVVGWVVDALLSDVLYADTLASAVLLPWRLVGVGLFLWLLVAWDGRMLARVKRMGRAPRWLAPWVERPRIGLLKPVRSALLITFLAAAATWDLIQGRAATGDGYNALVSVMDRVRFVNEAEETQTAGILAEEQVHALCGDELSQGAVYVREEAQKALSGHFGDWTRDRRQGVVMLTGDRGGGKRLFLDQVEPLLRLDGRPCRVDSIRARLGSREDALRWFADWFELEGVPLEFDALVAAAMDKPAQVQVVRRVHRTFLRKVRGFDALRTLLDLCHATSERHFWLLSLHRPAWAYLTRVGSLLNTSVVRGVVDLPPLTGPELRSLVLRRAEAAGILVDFRRLENTGPFGAPPEVEAERATSSYFRLLAEASGGCALAALHLFALSLKRGVGDTWDVVVIPELSGAGLANLTDGELFVLGALRMQDQLSLHELTEVVDASLDDVRSTTRELAHRGIVHSSEHGVRIDTLYVQRVTRALRRRHFLQWAV